MSKPTLAVLKNPSPTLEELEAQHRQVYAQFSPTLAQYQDMAKRVLDLQIQIFEKKIAAATGLLSARQSLVISISARETVAALQQVIARLEKEQIKVTTVIYDPRIFTFHLYSKAE